MPVKYNKVRSLCTERSVMSCLEIKNYSYINKKTIVRSIKYEVRGRGIQWMQTVTLYNFAHDRISVHRQTKYGSCEVLYFNSSNSELRITLKTYLVFLDQRVQPNSEYSQRCVCWMDIQWVLCTLWGQMSMALPGSGYTFWFCLLNSQCLGVW